MFRNESIWREDEDFDTMWSRYTSPERRKKKRLVPVTPNYWEAQPEFATLVRTHIPTLLPRRRHFSDSSLWRLTDVGVKKSNQPKSCSESNPWVRLAEKKDSGSTPPKLYGDNGIYRFTTPERAERNLDIVGRSRYSDIFKRSLVSYQEILDGRSCPEFNDMWRETFDRMVARELEFLAETTLSWERMLRDLERRHGINWGLSRLVWAA